MRNGAILVVFALTLTALSPAGAAEEQALATEVTATKAEAVAPVAPLPARPAEAAGADAETNGFGADAEDWRSGSLDKAGSFLPGELSGDVRVVSMRLFQSISNAEDVPAAEGSLAYVVDVGLPVAQPYVRFRGANARFEDGGEAATQLDFGFGLSGTLASMGWSIGGLHHTYRVSGDASANYSYWEIPLEVTLAVGEHLQLLGQYAYSPNFIGDTGHAHYLLVGARWEQSFRSATLSIEGTTGHQWIADNAAYGIADYQDWRLVASLTIALD